MRKSRANVSPPLLSSLVPTAWETKCSTWHRAKMEKIPQTTHVEIDISKNRSDYVYPLRFQELFLTEIWPIPTRLK